MSDRTITGEIEILQESHCGDFTCHTSEKAAELLCIVRIIFFEIICFRLVYLKLMLICIVIKSKTKIMTYFEFTKRFPDESSAINLVNVFRKGTSALQLQREMGMGSYESAWRIKNEIIKAIRLHGIEYELILQRKNHTTPWPEKMRLPK